MILKETIESIDFKVMIHFVLLRNVSSIYERPVLILWSRRRCSSIFLLSPSVCQHGLADGCSLNYRHKELTEEHVIFFKVTIFKSFIINSILNYCEICKKVLATSCSLCGPAKNAIFKNKIHVNNVIWRLFRASRLQVSLKGYASGDFAADVVLRKTARDDKSTRQFQFCFLAVGYRKKTLAYVWKINKNGLWKWRISNNLIVISYQRPSNLSLLNSTVPNVEK